MVQEGPRGERTKMKAVFQHCRFYVATEYHLGLSGAWRSRRSTHRVESDNRRVEVLSARAYPFVRSQLEIARASNELQLDVDIDLVARHLTGQSWGVVLLWMMGMLDLSDIVKERLRSELMTLVSNTRGAAKRRLESRPRELDME